MRNGLESRAENRHNSTIGAFSDIKGKANNKTQIDENAQATI